MEAFARHTAALVDHHLFLDNGSHDGTREILERLRAEGLSLEIHTHREVEFSEGEQVNYLFRLAATRRGEAPHLAAADWVIGVDADEFIDQRQIGEGWRRFFGNEKADIIAVRVRDYIACQEDRPDELVVPTRITHARAPSPHHRLFLRGSLFAQGAVLMPGYHQVMIGGQSLEPRFVPRIFLAHYSERSRWQWIAKFVKGWSRVLAGGPQLVAANHSVHYKAPFELLRDRPEQILRNPRQMQFPTAAGSGLEADPLPYLGGPLRYTSKPDPEARAIAALTQHIENLALRVGELTESRRKVTHPLTPKSGGGLG